MGPVTTNPQSVVRIQLSFSRLIFYEISGKSKYYSFTWAVIKKIRQIFLGIERDPNLFLIWSAKLFYSPAQKHCFCCCLKARNRDMSILLGKNFLTRLSN